MNGERKKRKSGAGLWVVPAIILFNLMTEGDSPMAVIMIMIVAISVALIWFIKKKAASASSDEPGTYTSKTPSWQQVRNDQNRGFDEQRARQNSSTMKTIMGSGRIYSNPIARINNEDSRCRMEELVDLLNAGIIEKEEYKDRMADLMKGN